VIDGRVSIEEGIDSVLNIWLQDLSSQVTPQSLEQGAHLRDPLDECKNDSASTGIFMRIRLSAHIFSPCC